MATVYFIKNPKGEMYIGSTKMKLKDRLCSYKNKRCKYQPKIYNSINTYGWDSHTIYSIECCDDCVRLLEAFYIKSFNTLKSGLNSILGGERLTESHIQASKNKSESKVVVFNMCNGSKVGCYDSPLEAELALGVNNKRFSRSSWFTINGKYIVGRSEKDLNKHSYKKNKGANCYQSRSVNKICIISNKILKTYPTIKQAGEENNINYKNIQSVCAGKRNNAGGYKWSYSW